MHGLDTKVYLCNPKASINPTWDNSFSLMSRVSTPQSAPNIGNGKWGGEEVKNDLCASSSSSVVKWILAEENKIRRSRSIIFLFLSFKEERLAELWEEVRMGWNNVNEVSWGEWRWWWLWASSICSYPCRITLKKKEKLFSFWKRESERERKRSGGLRVEFWRRGEEKRAELSFGVPYHLPPHQCNTKGNIGAWSSIIMGKRGKEKTSSCFHPRLLFLRYDNGVVVGLSYHWYEKRWGKERTVVMMAGPSNGGGGVDEDDDDERGG